MAKRWVVSAKKADFNAIAKKYGISPYLARIIRNRDIISDDDIDMFLNGTIAMMHDPSLLKDVDIASDIMKDAVMAGAPIRIVGDYDIDGVCASYILKKGLEAFGAVVDVTLPDRIKDGYGINEDIIQKAADDGIELIVTCDNGIAASKEIELAIQLGMSVIVTDHHEIPYEECDGKRKYILPPADAIVDPKQEDCGYPYEGICGAMVAYKLITYMMRGEDVPDKKALSNEILMFAAFATIGDVMELTNENRIAVRYGLELLKHTDNIGMNALIDVTGIDRDNISVFHIGFVLGPCVNATGRLDTALRALELFESTDSKKAVLIAQELKDLNESRKNMTLSFAGSAIEMVENNYMNDKVIVVYLPECHESIAGIVAGRVREKYYKPTIVLTNDADGGVKGSGRSIESYNMYEELTKVSDLFIKYGGHKMAAGMSMNPDAVDKLRRRLNDNCQLTDEDIIEKLVIDIPMPIGYVDISLVNEIERLAPFGVANPKPLFAQKDVYIKNIQLIGKNKNVLKMKLIGNNAGNENVEVDAVIFEDAQNAYAELCNREKVSVLYQAGLNEYMGRCTIQLIIKDYF